MSAAVVILLPGVDLGASVGRCREQRLVREFVLKSRVEALDDAVLLGFAQQRFACNPRERACPTVYARERDCR